MVTAAVLTADQRLAFQIHTWMKDLSDTVKLEIHRDFGAFVKKIETEVVAELIAAAANKKEDDVLDAEDIGRGKSDVFEPYYRLLIVDIELLQEKGLDPIEWTTSFKALLAERGRSDLLFPTAILFMAFDGGEFKIEAFKSPIIDDLIFKPLDRSVFLQKVELLTSDNPSKLRPTFLFRQKVELPIEIGKDAVVDEISEFGMALRNPTPIKPGVYASIFSSVFGDEDLARVIGRVYYSEPHPHIEGQFLVYFGFFGLKEKQLLKTRKIVRDRQPPSKFRVQQTPVPVIDPSIPFNRVAIIDMDLDVFKEIESALKDHYVGVQSQHYLSYARFLATLMKMFPGLPAQAAGTQAPIAGTPALSVIEGQSETAHVRPWTMPGSLTFTVGAESRILESIVSAAGEDDLIFGKSKQEWLVRPKAWLSDLSQHDKDELSEMLTFASTGGKGRALLHIANGDRTPFYLEAVAVTQARSSGEEASIRVEFKEMEEQQWKNANLHALLDQNVQLNPADFRYDALFIDANLIRGEDLQAWIDGIHELFLKAGIFARGEKMPRIFVMANEKSKIKPENYRFKGFADFLFKPLDRKMLSHKVKTVVDELVPRSEPETPHFVPQKLDVKLAKDAQMVEISEYGLSIIHPTPFKNGTMIRFFSPEIGGGADGVIGRCAYCEKTQDKVPRYICNFIFFGASDEILKRIRTWIREDYVQRKDVQS